MARITTLEELREIYGEPFEGAVLKETTRLFPHQKRFIELAPFMAISSTGSDGRGDVSPRGERPGFVHVLDDVTLALPDRPGNNRIDTLSNIVARPDIGLMFLLPGVNEVLRVNGKAELRNDSDLMERFRQQGRLPRLVVLIHVEQAYLHCAKALMRSALWDETTKVPKGTMPPMGQMLRDQIGERIPLESEEAALARYKTQLY